MFSYKYNVVLLSSHAS